MDPKDAAIAQRAGKRLAIAGNTDGAPVKYIFNWSLPAVHCELDSDQ
jgi:hypothetical protein